METSIKVLALIMPICSMVISFYSLSNENKKNLIKFITNIRNRLLVILMCLMPLAVFIYFSYLSIYFILSNAPINRMDLFIAPLYLFNLISWGLLTLFFYSSRKEMLDSFTNPKPENQS